MTKAFLEPIILKSESEKLITNAFSKKSIKKLQEFNKTKRVKLKRTKNRKLSVDDVFA
jgi:hypothetical protein